MDGVLELAVEPRRSLGGALLVGMPLRTEGFDGFLVEGKEDSEVWRLAPLVLAVVPLVDGR